MFGGCVHNTAAPPVSVSGVPLLKSYSPEFQDQLYDELRIVRECCPATNEFVNDSVKLRKKVKAAHEISATQDRLERSGGLLKGLFGRKQ